jgi:parallel beta-helix repeat protein
LAWLLSFLLLPSPVAHAEVIGCAQAGDHLVIDATTELDPSCVYTGGIEIVASGVTLDCRGATIRDVDGEAGAPIGILVTTPADVALHDVAIRNCRIEGFLNGVRITRAGFRSLAPGEEYADAPHDILVEASEIRASRGAGVFVDAYVTRVTLRDLLVQGAGSSGIYLEAGSRDNAVLDNRVIGNGFGPAYESGQHVDFLGSVGVWVWSTGREGISVDGSRGNRIVGNRLEGNAAGGIFLYKNCGEYAHQQAESWWERRYGADGNLVEGNVIANEPTGVWVGSRIGENTLALDCSDPPYVEGPLLRVSLDRAQGNVIRDNAFHGVLYGVRVEDDRTVVEGNRFTGDDPAQLAVVVGTRWRTERLGEPVAGTVLASNRTEIAGNPSPYRWVYGQEDTVFTGNTALGHPAGFCQAPPIPSNPFLFVRAFVLHRAGDPPPAVSSPPAVPSLGVLEPCPPGETASHPDGAQPATSPTGSSHAQGAASLPVVEPRLTG